jgi:excisionase family DNA binding protein
LTKKRSSEGTLDNEDAAHYLGCKPGTLRVWVSKRKVPFVKVGRLVRFRKADLDAWLESNFKATFEA